MVCRPDSKPNTINGTSAKIPANPIYAELQVRAYSCTGTAKTVRLPPITVTIPASQPPEVRRVERGGVGE